MAEALIVAPLQIERSVEGATAADIAARVVDALSDQGYRVVEVSQTLLGRLRIVAESYADKREVIVSRTTGAVLRDRITATFDVGVSGITTTDDAISGAGETNGGITGRVTGCIDLDVGVNIGNATDAGSRGSVGGSVSVGIVCRAARTTEVRPEHPTS